MAWVSIPAYDDATALAMVAELNETQLSEVKRIQKMIEEASTSTKPVVGSDVNNETIAYWVYRAVDQLFQGSPLRIERICPDTIILYDFLNGKTYRAEYRIGEENIDIMDLYEVEYIRKERGEEELNEEMIESTETAELTVDKTEETLVETEAPVIAEEAKPESEKETVVSEEIQEEAILEAEAVEETGNPVATNQNADSHDAAVLIDTDALIAELETLKAEVEELNGIKVKYEELVAEKQEKEMSEKRETIKVFAAKFGLKETDQGVAEAIANLDYEAIVNIAASLNVKETPEKKPNPFISEIKPSKEYTLLDVE